MKEYVITVKETSNKAILKFEANHFLTTQSNYEFKNIDEAKASPLAQQLFYLPFIKTVYISGNFIALERYDIVEWDDVRDEVAQQLVEYLNSGAPVIVEDTRKASVPVTLYAEVTPNPAVMKFVANKKLVPSSFEFKNIDEAKDSELARALFHFPYVKEVFMDENYISVTKFEVADWNEITMELREMIRNHIAEGKEIVSALAASTQAKKADKQGLAGSTDETSQQIIQILEEYVKPAVASDGGNILFQSYDEKERTVSVILQGACSGCPSSTFTLKNGIETMLKNMLGDKVSEVVAING
ncbi:Fe-S cluster biogenesis protein NfuA, 4Fe-4S-binding domain [Muriicola jejuensis]|uniref:NifU family protein n=1 Tax=Muriicola jejuensis TaxID=504488 RepID=A0A6P0U8K4_9FLAO|nr:NifU family protein [Muriicola jejuensis]NER09477.1 NifU family protein [Muriicola jejuensis]SMP08298.1 Fe-S cluster biogenesis protein NfuA, 4Fe-4S-binding domain [Muriicola jejuensis]